MIGSGNKKIGFLIVIGLFILILTNANATPSFKENADKKTLEILDIFEAISAIPRCSYNESKIRSWLRDRAHKNGLKYSTDLIGNILINVPASKGYENVKIISIIDDFEIIDKISRVTFRLKHLNLWDIRNHDPPEVEPVYA